MPNNQEQLNKAFPVSVSYTSMSRENDQQPPSSISELIRQHGESCQKDTASKASILEMMLESICNGVLLIEAESRTIVYANDAAAKAIGTTKEQMLGRICHEYTCPTKEGTCPILDLGKRINESEEVLLTADGAETPIIKTVVSVQWQDKMYLVESFTDITHFAKTYREQDKLRQKLEDMNKELTDFAYVVSHDLKAPLRGIKSLADWIICDHSTSLNKEGQEQLTLLQNRVDRMQELINGILEYSRLGQVSERPTEIDLNTLLPDIIDMLAISEDISIDIQKELPTLQCEKTRVSQIFQNLLSNAVKYRDKSKASIKVACSDDQAYWRFSITDNGPGIKKQYQDKIFQLFQTLQPKDESDSTGIGLSVVKKSVTMHGGRVWVESEVGQGSTFFFTLPKNEGTIP